MMSSNSNSKRTFDAFLPMNLIERYGELFIFCLCFCNFYIFAKVFDFADIFELQSEGLESFDGINFNFGAGREKLGFVGIGGGNIYGFIVEFVGGFEDIDDTVDGPYFAV